jgi:restriction endonuclease Mrr
MVAEIDDAKRMQFHDIFLHPTINAMHDLTPDDFELFIKYVFECAGYEVEYVAELRYPVGPGVDLNLYQSNAGGERLLKARVEVRRYAPNNHITLQAVREDIGTLHLAGGVHGYLITTSDFQQNAYIAEGDAQGAVRLINGAHLMRYIAYVGGSVYTDEHSIERTPYIVSPAYLFEADAISRRNTKHPHSAVWVDPLKGFWVG